MSKLWLDLKVTWFPFAKCSPLYLASLSHSSEHRNRWQGRLCCSSRGVENKKKSDVIILFLFMVVEKWQYRQGNFINRIKNIVDIYRSWGDIMLRCCKICWLTTWTIAVWSSSSWSFSCLFWIIALEAATLSDWHAAKICTHTEQYGTQISTYALFRYPY